MFLGCNSGDDILLVCQVNCKGRLGFAAISGPNHLRQCANVRGYLHARPDHWLYHLVALTSVSLVGLLPQYPHLLQQVLHQNLAAGELHWVTVMYNKGVGVLVIPSPVLDE